MTVTVFKRCELKYLLDRGQLAAVMDALDEYMSPDRFHRTSVRNVYFDTENFLLARRSIDKPLYKEKLRFRSYGRPSEGDDIFVELKKKYDSVVYKRRLTMPLSDAMDWFLTEDGKGPDTQIGREIGFLKERYPGIRPAMLLCYEREAYCAKDGGDLRITIDSDVTAGTDDTDLCRGNGTFRVLPDGYTLMEVKSMYGYPWWLVSVLGENGISVLCAHGYLFRACDNAELIRDTEAALRAPLFALRGDNLGIDQLNDKFLFPFGYVCLHHQHNPAQHTDLGCGKTHPIGGIQGFCHVIEKDMQSVVKFNHRTGGLVQCRVSLCEDIP
ncbi:MAG: polyphosphate polymerase domain-containing protein [Candidatus Methanomethylophilaceae archaeon]|nr:polyphosphate polymerase domain-containing protein [Candidatus Methanomethylophilaceae archaeon]